MGFENELKLGDTFQELPKSKYQVQHADNIGHFPFFTSGDSILSHSLFNVDDDLIFLATGGKANVKFHSGKAAYSTDTYAIKGKNHSSNYLYYLLLNNLSFIDRNFFSGSGLKHLQKKDFKNWLLSFPDDITEEKKIVQFLYTIDRVIVSTEQLITKYQCIKIGLLHDLLTRGIDEHDNLRSEKTHKFKNSKLGRIPMEWDPSTIGKSCFVRNEFRLPLSQEVRAKMQGDYRYYGPTGIFDYINEYRVEGKYVLIGEDGDHFLKYKTQEQTILVEGKFNVNNHAHILEGSKDCLTEWIHLFFSLRDITLHLTRQGAGRYKLNKTSLLNLDIALPKVDEQREILKRVEALKNKNEQDKLNLYKLQSLKSGLMQALLSGKVRVKQ
jgi:restriction endonuclease S subunit